MKKLTREERRRRSQRRLMYITYLLFLLLLLAWLLSYMVMTAEAEPGAAEAQETAIPAVYLGEPQDGRLPGDDTPATERCYLTEGELANENELIEAALLNRSHKLEDVTITFYCCEQYPHICGTGNGITASGRRVTPYVSCAVDPDVIPLGSTVMLEHNGEMVYLRADDTGGSIKGNRLDIAVKGHQEALSLGVKTADIWWCEE